MAAQALLRKKELVADTGERLLNEGMKKGLQKGKEEGILQGMQEGMQEGIQKGIQLGIVEGLLEGIELGIGVKFGARGMKLMPAIRKIQDPERLRAIKEAVKIAESTAEIEELI